MGGTLSFPITSKALTRTGTPQFTISACEMQGYRSTMEDYRTIILDFQQQQQQQQQSPHQQSPHQQSPHQQSPHQQSPHQQLPPSQQQSSPPQLHQSSPQLHHSSPTATTTKSPPVFVGVFDGHCSDNAAAWFSENFPKELKKQPSLAPNNIKNACLAADIGYRGYVRTNLTVSPGGTTAVFAIIEEMDNPKNPAKPYKLTVGNIGDSRCLVVRGELVEQITVDHKPTDFHEQQRILAAGGAIENDRVDGLLAVSRAFGDTFLKSNSRVSAEEQKVSAVPDVFVVENVGGDDMVLLICDGVYEQSTNKQAVDLLKKFLLQTPQDPARALGRMFGTQVLRSGDNMTSILVQFQDGSQYSKVSEQGEVEYVPMELECRQMYRLSEADYEKLKRAFQSFGARYGYPTGYIVTTKDAQGTTIKDKKEKEVSDEGGTPAPTTPTSVGRAAQ